MDTLLSYWSIRELAANGIILLHLLGALALGIVIGFERSYHGRAAGMRTYALVCMASTALTVINGYPGLWYGGLSQTTGIADPTRVIQGIMTGIGFLGAGLIMKEGFTIRGLSTAASVWMTAAVGVLIGVGFYAAGIFAAILSITVLSGFHWVERLLPHERLLHLSIAYPHTRMPTEGNLRQLMRLHDFEVVDWAYQLGDDGNKFEYLLVLKTLGSGKMSELAKYLAAADDIIEFRLAPSRN